MMIVDESFIEMIMEDYELNKMQFEILGEPYPPNMGWEALILNKDISDDDVNLLILLKGKLPIKTQNKILKNYQEMIKFTNQSNKSFIEEKNINQEINAVEIYCDGACINNPGKAGSGLVIYDNKDFPTLLFGEYQEVGTNNTAELNALYKALQIASEKKKSIIYSDSKYSIDCITNWAYGWKSKNWTKKGGEIKNLDIIKKAHTLYDKIKDNTDVKHVKAHAGIEGNELADRMAMVAIKVKSEKFKEYKYKKIKEVLELDRG